MVTSAALHRWLANQMPFLGVPSRFVAAVAAAAQATRGTYSQHGEDTWLFDQLRQEPKAGAIYIDVGANHPSRISNTYLLYRNGFSGVVVEPNAELLRLHRMFRPRDIAIGVACGERAEVASFQIMSAPAMSFFAGNQPGEATRGLKVVRTEYLPILPLDEVLTRIDFRVALLLSIDTEGHDAKVLRGARATLAKTRFVCVEVNDEAAEKEVRAELDTGFEVVRRFGCNIVFRNRQTAD